jgi:hypothetical protein
MPARLRARSGPGLRFKVRRLPTLQTARFFGCAQRRGFQFFRFCGSCLAAVQNSVVPDGDINRWLLARFLIFSVLIEYQERGYAKPFGNRRSNRIFF